MLYPNGFRNQFNNLLSESGTSCYQLAQFSEVDEAYIHRLKTGEKTNPSVEVVMRLALAFMHFNSKIGINETNELFHAIGRSLDTKRKGSY